MVLFSFLFPNFIPKLIFLLDDELDNISRVLRLLYLQDLKALQIGINDLISSIQSYTAEIKVDSSLGVVGR